MNITLISLLQNNIYSSLLFSGSKSYQLESCSFSRSFAFFFYNTNNLNIKNSVFKSGLKALIYNDLEYECIRRTTNEDYIIGCYLLGIQCVINKGGTEYNLNIESTCFFNCTTSESVIIFFPNSNYHSASLIFDNCCFYNLNAKNSIIQAHSYCKISHSTFLKNPSSNIFFSSSVSELISNNISYNYLTDNTDFFFFTGSNAEMRGDLNYMTFAHNFYGAYFFNLYNYNSTSLSYSAFINNSISISLILLSHTNPSSSSIFTLQKCTFCKNMNFMKMISADIFTTRSTNLRITIYSCLLDTSLPQSYGNNYYYYVQNIENTVFSQISGNYGGIPNVQIITPPSPSKGYECVVIIPKTSQTGSPTEIITKTPTATPSETPTHISSETSSISTDNPTETQFFPISPIPSEILTSTPAPKNKMPKAVLVVAILFPIITVVLIVIIVTWLLRRKGLLCFGDRGFASNTIDLLQSNPPIVESSQSDVMSGKVNVFDKVNRNELFDYSLVV